MSNTPPKVTAAQMASLNAAKSHPPTGPKIYSFPADSGLSNFAWNKQLNDAALQGWKFYVYRRGAIGGRHQVAPGIWVEMLGDSIVAQYPVNARDFNWVSGVIADRIKNANAGVLGAGFDKYVVPLVFTAVIGLLTAGVAAELAPEAGSAAGGTGGAAVDASTVSTSFTAAGAVPINLANSSAVIASTASTAPTAASAFLTAADSSISFTAANAAAAPGLISSIVSNALTGGDLVANALVNAGVTAQSLSVVAPLLSSSVAAASFSAASTPSLGTALDVLAQPSTSLTDITTPNTTIQPNAPSPAPATNPSLISQAQTFLTTMPVEPSTILTAVKTVQQYNQGRTAVAQAAQQSQIAQQQAVAREAAARAAIAASNAPSANPLTNLSPGVILSALAAGAAFLMS
jgi:hypothetical protein